MWQYIMAMIEGHLMEQVFHLLLPKSGPHTPNSNGPETNGVGEETKEVSEQ